MLDLRKERAAALERGIVTRELILDNIFSVAELEAANCWERDPVLDNWIRVTPEFLVARRDAETALHEQRDFAEIALATCLLELSAQLPPQEDGPPGPVAPNRQLYVAVTSVPWKEGERINRCESYHAAISAWKQRLLEYAAANDGDTLWWRHRPEIDGRVPFGEAQAGWTVYCRLAIGTAA